MHPARSLLFVPGNNEQWLRNAHTHGADVVIFDLEDSVPPAEKARARDLVNEYIPKIHAKGQTVFARVNGHPRNSTEWTEKDLETVVCDELAAVFMPKARQPSDVEALEVVLNHVERRDDCSDRTEIVIAIETAPAMKNVYDLCAATDTVTSIVCGATKGTDANHALGFRWTGPGAAGLETLHMRQKALLDARAAGIENPIAGTYTSIDDEEGLRQEVEFSRDMGYLGYVAIHPAQVPIINEVFTPDAETVEYWQGAKEALADAKSAGKYAVQYRGDMIDVANLSTADRYLNRAKMFED